MQEKRSGAIRNEPFVFLNSTSELEVRGRELSAAQSHLNGAALFGGLNRQLRRVNENTCPLYGRA
jgi:hypothetical protein